jgi:hypothetical protein
MFCSKIVSFWKSVQIHVCSVVETGLHAFICKHVDLSYVTLFQNRVSFLCTRKDTRNPWWEYHAFHSRGILIDKIQIKIINTSSNVIFVCDVFLESYLYNVQM